MKPWEMKRASIEKRLAATLTVEEHVKGIGCLMNHSASYWRELGKRKPIVAQFELPNSSWYVQVDGDGGCARKGTHPAPTVTWRSDVEAMDAAFRGRVLPGRVRVIGDFEEMRALFTAIAQTQLN